MAAFKVRYIQRGLRNTESFVDHKNGIVLTADNPVSGDLSGLADLSGILRGLKMDLLKIEQGTLADIGVTASYHF